MLTTAPAIRFLTGKQHLINLLMTVLFVLLAGYTFYRIFN
jgi:hypothetical protein